MERMAKSRLVGWRDQSNQTSSALSQSIHMPGQLSHVIQSTQWLDSSRTLQKYHYHMFPHKQTIQYSTPTHLHTHTYIHTHIHVQMQGLPTQHNMHFNVTIIIIIGCSTHKAYLSFSVWTALERCDPICLVLAIQSITIIGNI